MSLQNGPRKIEKISPGSKVQHFQTSSTNPHLLIASPDYKLSSFFLKVEEKPKTKNKLLPMRKLQVNEVPELFSFCGAENIVHCEDDTLLINNKTQLKQRGKINLMQADEQTIVCSSLDCITINSVSKRVQIGKLHEEGSTISSLFWRNSMIISGDQTGNLHLWDFNKERLVHQIPVFTSKVDHISAYVDFVSTNFFYSISKEERKMSFHDLRTFKPIATNTNLPTQLIKSIHNESGKIFLMDTQNLSVIDVYKSYDILGKFSNLTSWKLDDYLLKYPEAISQNRDLTDMITWNQFIITSCDNGCIEVYNSDTFECSYGYGLCDGAITTLKKFHDNLVALDAQSHLTIANF